MAATQKGAPVGVPIADRGGGGVILGHDGNAIALTALPVPEAAH
jgi:hypothetical protein